MHTLELDDSSTYGLVGTCSECPVDYDYVDEQYIQVSGIVVRAETLEDLYLEFREAHL